MPRTQRLIVASLVLVVGLGMGFLLSGVLASSKSPLVDYSSEAVMVPLSGPEKEFKQALDTLMHVSEKDAIGGYTPDMLLEALPALRPEDFSGTAAVLGRYEYTNGQLTYTNTEIVDGAADNLSDEGIRTLRNNVYRRLGLAQDKAASSVLELLKSKASATSTSTVPVLPATAAGTVCPQDAKICPDGSSVGRTGLACDFAACPTHETSTKHVSCTTEQREVMCSQIYKPVCASYQVQCIKAPCNPVSKTYGNSCSACSDKNVISYSDGECVGTAP